MDDTANFYDPNNMMSDGYTADTATAAYNADDSGTLDEPLLIDSTPVSPAASSGNSTQAQNTTAANGNTAAAAAAAPSGWSSFFSNTLPGLLGTATNSAAQAAAGAVATQTKTATTANNSATAPAPGTGFSLSSLTQNQIILGVVGLLVVVLVLMRRKG